MKKPYQIEVQRAVKQLDAMATDGNPAVQTMLPMAEMVGWLKKGVGELIRQAGLQVMDLLMQEDVRDERSQRLAGRTASRWGSEQGYCVVMGQKVPVRRPRVRTVEDKGVRLGGDELFHRGEPLTETVWEKLMLGLSTRKYDQAVRQFTEAYGLEKSAVSEHFIEASRTKLKDMMESRLVKLRLCVLLIDATPFEGQQMVAALGIGQDGRKTILGIRQGATENATVVGELLGDLVSRGLDFTEPRGYVLDGGKALTAAGEKYAGDSAAIQRCQVHKRRNVLDHLTDEQKPAVAKRLNAAYAMEDYATAKQALNQLHRQLMDLNPSAARSLGEGMHETLTVHRLHAPMQLRKTLASTNVIESAFSIVEVVCRNVKRWQAASNGSEGSGRAYSWRRSSSAALQATNRFHPSSENWKPWHRLRKPLSRRERRRRVDYAGVVTFNGLPGIPWPRSEVRFPKPYEGMKTAIRVLRGVLIRPLSTPDFSLCRPRRW